jgi:hypothetical protein
MSKPRNLIIATLIGATIVATTGLEARESLAKTPAAPAASGTAASAAGVQHRDAYVSVVGAKGSARIYWKPVRGGYKSWVSGTVSDTKPDDRAARLYVGFEYRTLRSWVPLIIDWVPGKDTVATARGYGKRADGSLIVRSHSRWAAVRNVTIHVCTINGFGFPQQCSRAG